MLPWFRRAGVGRLLYHTWYKPIGFVERAQREGAINLLIANLCRKKMEKAAATLMPTLEPVKGAPKIYFLTGKRFAYQTAFCAASLRKHANTSLQFVFVDDGTLSKATQRLLTDIAPGCLIVTSKEVDARLNEVLPSESYPELRRRRLLYPHIRKLTDIHSLSGTWKLVLDSDMLFFRRPALLLEWLRDPQRPICMRDVADAYGYSPDLMKNLANGPIPSRVNVGICGLNSSQIDWPMLERWSSELVNREGAHYLLEQALVALMLVGRNAFFAPVEDYVVSPLREEVKNPSAVLHHYTAESKAWYFRFAWRRAETQINKT